MKKINCSIILLLLIIGSIFLTSCGTIQVVGKTFVYENVSIDWGMAEEKDKQLIYEKYSVNSHSELIEYLKTYNNRNNRVTTFGTDNKYVTKNEKNEIIDSGYYRQDDDLITLSETEDGFHENTSYTLDANDKGYIVLLKLDNDLKVFAKYQYIEQS
jgi:hypothetical protein